MTDSEGVARDIEDMIKDYEKGGIIAKYEALMKFKDLMHRLPTEFKDCEKIRPDLNRFAKWASIFIHPFRLSHSLITNLPAHYQEVMADYREAKEDWRNH